MPLKGRQDWVAATLSEAEWRLLEPLLPPERGRKSRPAFDNRQIVNGMMIATMELGMIGANGAT
jgi:hypothetical protein